MPIGLYQESVIDIGFFVEGNMGSTGNRETREAFW